MAVLVPGALLKLLQHINSDAKQSGDHRSSLLQVISIVPALAGADLYTSKGFYLKVSDSSHATYASLPDGDSDLILSDKIQLGQFVYVDRLEAASPVPTLKGVRPVPGRRACIGSPEDIRVTCPMQRKMETPIGQKEKAKLKKSNAAAKLEALEVKKASSLNRSISSLSKQSPTRTCRSSPGSVKQQQAKPATTRLGLLERAASVLKATATGRKSSAGNLSGNLSSATGSGPKALRKSWEGNSDAKMKDLSNQRAAKSETKPVVRSSSIPRRTLLTEAKPSCKEDNKVHNTSKKANSSLNSDVSDRSSKQRNPIAKRTSQAPHNLSLGNLMKVPSASRKLTTSSSSWESLPSSLRNLGKEVLMYRDAAAKAAVDAMQEASAAETLLRCLSVHSELTTSASELGPHQTVNRFLSLHSSLSRAAASLSDDSLAAGRRRLAASWLHAAIATDLSPFSLYSSPAKPVVVAAASPATRPPASPSSPPPTSSPGTATEVPVETARKLREQTTAWFLGYVERFLDADVASPGASDRMAVAGMLSQLKRVNDWLDAVGSGSDGGEEAVGSAPNERIERVRKKIYEYLLTHVETAVVALNGGVGKGGERMSSRRR